MTTHLILNRSYSFNRFSGVGPSRFDLKFVFRQTEILGTGKTVEDDGESDFLS